MASDFIRIVISLIVCQHYKCACIDISGTGSSAFQLRVPLGHNVSLPCVVPKNCRHISWNYVSRNTNYNIFDNIILSSDAKSPISLHLHLTNIREADLGLYRCVCRKNVTPESVITSINLTAAACEILDRVNDDTLVLSITYQHYRHAIDIQEGDTVMIQRPKKEHSATNCSTVKESSFFKANLSHHLCHVACILKFGSKEALKECVDKTVSKISPNQSDQSLPPTTHTFKDKSKAETEKIQTEIILILSGIVAFLVCFTAALLTQMYKLKVTLRSQLSSVRTGNNLEMDAHSVPVYAVVKKPISATE